MFGHKWQAAEGTIVEIKSAGQHGSGIYAMANRVYVIDVRPASGEPFRTEVPEPKGRFIAPTAAGETVALKCDPARKEARFDLSNRDDQMARHVAALQAEAERLEEREGS